MGSPLVSRVAVSPRRFPLLMVFCKFQRRRCEEEQYSFLTTFICCEGRNWNSKSANDEKCYSSYQTERSDIVAGRNVQPSTDVCESVWSEKSCLCRIESTPPMWVMDHSIPYFQLDLTTTTSQPKANQAMEFLLEQYPNIETIVIGVRPFLFTPYINRGIHEDMVKGLATFLDIASLSLKKLKFVLHLSSVAAAGHLRAQVFWNENHPLPDDLSQYKAPYDLFKQRSEHEITRICNRYSVPCCNLRLSAIFSDETSCIQCSALYLQCRVGCYLPLMIDCNSSANVSRAMDSILGCAEKGGDIQTIYYYTRPLLLQQPVAYGYYLQEFRKAYGIHSIDIPVWVVTYFVAFFHWVASWNVLLRWPFVDATDCLLQVAARDHYFDCSRFAKDFSDDFNEESIFECFVRRKTVLESCKRPSKAAATDSKVNKLHPS